MNTITIAGKQIVLANCHAFCYVLTEFSGLNQELK